MGILNSSEIADWQQVVNVLSRMLRTPFAHPITPSKGLPSSRPPSDAIRSGRPTFPTRMIRPSGELRLPLPHTRGIAEYALGIVEIACRSRDVFPAPVTGLCHSVTSFGIRSTDLPLLSTIPRAILLSPSPLDLIATSQAIPSLRISPAVSQIARARTKSLIASIDRVIRLLAFLTIPRFTCLSHTDMIPFDTQ